MPTESLEESISSLKLTKHEHNGASQLNSSVRWTSRGEPHTDSGYGKVGPTGAGNTAMTDATDAAMVGYSVSDCAARRLHDVANHGGRRRAA
jgi:hypothetical protein